MGDLESHNASVNIHGCALQLLPMEASTPAKANPRSWCVRIDWVTSEAIGVDDSLRYAHRDDNPMHSSQSLDMPMR